jgi:hypothetical protein
MNRLLPRLIIFFSTTLFLNVSNAQNLTQGDFLTVCQPQIIGSGTSYRLPVVFRATVQNLTPNTIYRYYIQAAKFSDMGSTNTGAGNSLYMNPDSSKFVYTTSPGISTTGTYSIFTTDASGIYTGWFGFVYTGNARFTAGNYIIPTITIGLSSTIVYRLALNDSILVTSFGSTMADTNGTGIWGKSVGNPMNIVLLYDNITGTGKPLSISYFESDGTTISSIISFYSANVNENTGRWGTIIPNNNANGIRRIEQRALSDNNLIGFETSSDGIWSLVSTVNPTGGLTPLQIDSLTVLPVELISFSGKIKENEILLSWKTATELNNMRFDIERKVGSPEWQKIGSVDGAGNSSTIREYSFTDKSLLLSGNYYYRLKQIDLNGNFKYSHAINAEVNITPQSYWLEQNYPNPFNPSTTISFNLPYDSYVKLIIYNALGKMVREVINGFEADGRYKIDVKAEDLASGIYYYTLQANSTEGPESFRSTNKMILLK